MMCLHVAGWLTRFLFLPGNFLVLEALHVLLIQCIRELPLCVQFPNSCLHIREPAIGVLRVLECHLEEWGEVISDILTYHTLIL